MDFEKFVIDSLEEIKDNQERTLVQTTRTNGRVTNLEEWRRDIAKEIECLKENKHNNKGRDNVIEIAVRAIATIAFAIFMYWLGTKK